MIHKAQTEFVLTIVDFGREGDGSPAASYGTPHEMEDKLRRIGVPSDEIQRAMNRFKVGASEASIELPLLTEDSVAPARDPYKR